MSTPRVKLVLAAAVWLVVLVVLAPVANATSLCGVEATGKKADGTMWTGVAPRMFVGPDGFWHICQPWVPDGGDPLMPKPEPKPEPCAEVLPPVTWTIADRTCTSLLKQSQTPHGSLSIAIAETGHTRGVLIQRCVNSKRDYYGATCTFANGCDRAATINTRVGDVSVDATPRANNTRVKGLKAERGTVDLVCLGGSWLVERTVSK